MDDIGVLLEFDSRYGYDENSSHRHHNNNSSNTPRYTSNPIAGGGPMSASTFNMSMVSEFDPVSAAIYPSPTSSERGTTASPRATTPDQQQWIAGEDGGVKSPTPTEGADATEAAAGAGGKPPAKRKRENRYKNAPPSVLSRRRAQNRASQRAYRERKDQRIKDLEIMLAEQKQKNDALGQAYSLLHTEYSRLRGGPIQGRPQPTTPILGGQSGAMPMYDVSGMNYGTPDPAMFMYPDMTTDYAS